MDNLIYQIAKEILYNECTARNIAINSDILRKLDLGIEKIEKKRNQQILDLIEKLIGGLNKLEL